MGSPKTLGYWNPINLPKTQLNPNRYVYKVSQETTPLFGLTNPKVLLSNTSDKDPFKENDLDPLYLQPQHSGKDSDSKMIQENSA